MQFHLFHSISAKDRFTGYITDIYLYQSTVYMLYIVHAHEHLNPIHVVDIFICTQSLLPHLSKLFLR